VQIVANLRFFLSSSKYQLQRLPEVLQIQATEKCTFYRMKCEKHSR